MCDRDHQYRSVRKDDRDRIPRRGRSRSICAWSRLENWNCRPAKSDLRSSRTPISAPVCSRRTLANTFKSSSHRHVQTVNMTCRGLKISGGFSVFTLALWLAVCSQQAILAQSDKARTHTQARHLQKPMRRLTRMTVLCVPFGPGSAHVVPFGPIRSLVRFRPT